MTHDRCQKASSTLALARCLQMKGKITMLHVASRWIHLEFYRYETRGRQGEAESGGGIGR